MANFIEGAAAEEPHGKGFAHENLIVKHSMTELHRTMGSH